MLSVPTPLLDYLKTAPVPVIVFSIDFQSPISIFEQVPLLSNKALLEFTRGVPLLSCLSTSSRATFISWINRCRESIDDISLNLNLIAKGNQPALSTVFTWRRTLAQEAGRSFLILTGLHLPCTNTDSDMEGIETEASTLDPAHNLRYGPAGGEILTAEKKLLELEVLIDRSEVGLARLDLAGRLHWVSKSWRKMMEYPEHLPLDEWGKSIHEEDVERLVSRWQYCMKNMERMEIQFRIKGPSATSLLAIVTPNHEDISKATGWISNLTDVTQAMKAEEAVSALAVEKEATKFAESRREDAEEQRRQQELLIDVTSHEIRNPISAIMQNAEVLRASLSILRSTLTTAHERGTLPFGMSEKSLLQLDEDIEAIESIGECAMAQERIANDILGLAQIQLGKYSITSVPFRLTSTLRTTLRMFASECRLKDICMELKLGEGIARLGHPAEISADPVRLSQIIINLVSNAVRFTAGSDIRNITLSVNVSHLEPEATAPIICPDDSEFDGPATSPLFLYFSVEDSGPGMTEEQAGRVFERFQQASPLTHVTMGGSGLGLWIARNLCELHSGRIDLVSEPGVGSSFRGYIKAAFPNPRQNNQLPSPTATLLASPVLSRLKPLRILVAEDNEINMRVLVRQLKANMHDVSMARDGREALEKLLDPEAEPFDACLMDIEMPILSGTAATRAIRLAEVGTGKRLRIVGCTGNARDGQVKDALESGMDQIITKPYRLANLLEALAGPTT